MRSVLFVITVLVAFPGSVRALDLPASVADKLSEEISASLSAEQSFADTSIAQSKPLYYHWATSGEYADNVATTVMSPSPGLFREEIIGKGEDGASVADIKFATLGGLLPLVTEFQPSADGSTMGEVLSDYEIDGAVFPLAPGNEFTVAWETVFLGTNKPFMNAEYECAVERLLDASGFMVNLSGKAYEVVCNVEIMGQNAGTEVYYYLVDAGYFVPDHGRGDLTTQFEVKLGAQ